MARINNNVNNSENGNLQLRSAIYVCKLSHCRVVPRKYQFSNKIFLFYLDLDEIDKVAKEFKPIGYNQFNLYSFYEKDFYNGESTKLKQRILNFSAENGVELSADTQVFFLCQLRTIGYIFNPASFYFLHDKKNGKKLAIVEITNTFKERKMFILKENDGRFFHAILQKNFYISPFSRVDEEMKFNLEFPQDAFKITISHQSKGKNHLTAVLHGKRQKITTKNLLICQLKFPLQTLRTISLIHWHALKLWLKNFPFYRKKYNINKQTEILNPHKSLTENADLK